MANVTRCPISTDKSKIEYQALPEGETKEVIVELRNTTQKMMLAEVVPPNFQYSGIMVNPLVISMAPGRQALVSIKYTAGFRDLTAAQMNNIKKPKGINNNDGENADGMPKGLVQKNKKILERLEKKKADAAGAALNAAGAGAAAGKKGGPAPAQPPPPAAKGADPKAAAAASNLGPGGREIIVPKGKTRE